MRKTLIAAPLMLALAACAPAGQDAAPAEPVDCAAADPATNDRKIANSSGRSRCAASA